MAQTSQAVKMLRRQAAEILPNVIHRELREWKRHGYQPTAILLTEDLHRLLLNEYEGTMVAMDIGREGKQIMLFDLPIKSIGGDCHWELVTNKPWERA